MSFLPDILRVRENARKEDLNILVWGPGDPGPSGDEHIRRCWRKRCQIRDVLRLRFPFAEVAFSEDDALRDHTRDLEDLLVEELVHAVAADCILILDVSRGTHVEVDRFSEFPEIASKMRVFLPERHVGYTGPGGIVMRGLRVQAYSDAEFDKCELATRVAVAIVFTIALDKTLRRFSHR